MSVELKIKSKHLSEESKIIRHEEKKYLGAWRYDCNKNREDQANAPLVPWENTSYNTYEKLHNHRVFDVRFENRATFLARAYLAGKVYKSVESSRKDEVVFKVYILPRLTAMVAKYGENKIQKDKYVLVSGIREKVVNPEYIALQETLSNWAS